MITFAADTGCLDVTPDNASFQKASAHVLTSVQWRMHTALQLGRTLTLLSQRHLSDHLYPDR